MLISGARNPSHTKTHLLARLHLPPIVVVFSDTDKRLAFEIADSNTASAVRFQLRDISIRTPPHVSSLTATTHRNERVLVIVSL